MRITSIFTLPLYVSCERIKPDVKAPARSLCAATTL